ncbi:MAG TPA: magnesium transporter [Oculatellaceae cyanobacterium]
MTERRPLATEQVTALVDDNQRQELRLILNDQHPADLAEWLDNLEEPYQLFCFRLLDLDNASAVLSELSLPIQRKLLAALGDLGVVPLISRMPADDAVDLLAELPREKARTIIGQMTDIEAADDIYELLGFKEDTAGGIMSTDYLALDSKMTAAEALERLRQQYEDLEEDIYDVYVVDEQERLLGSMTIKDLITAAPSTLVTELMDDNVVKVNTATDQEEAAEKVERYDLLTLPVVDESGKLRGVITADDIMDVLREEADEDILQSSGIAAVGPESTEVLTQSIRHAFSARLPWLLATLLIETGSASVITHFDHVIQQTVAAASFMPLLSGVTGSVATQSTCLVIRASSKNSEIDMRAVFRNIWHELRVGMLLGLCCGLLTGGMSFLLHQSQHNLGLVVGLSLFATMSVGVMIGTLMPMLFQKLGVDPAHASGPFITSILDVCTMSIYLTIVHAFLLHIV